MFNIFKRQESRKEISLTHKKSIYNFIEKNIYLIVTESQKEVSSDFISLLKIIISKTIKDNHVYSKLTTTTPYLVFDDDFGNGFSIIVEKGTLERVKGQLIIVFSSLVKSKRISNFSMTLDIVHNVFSFITTSYSLAETIIVNLKEEE